MLITPPVIITSSVKPVLSGIAHPPLVLASSLKATVKRDQLLPFPIGILIICLGFREAFCSESMPQKKTVSKSVQKLIVEINKLWLG